MESVCLTISEVIRLIAAVRAGDKKDFIDQVKHMYGADNAATHLAEFLWLRYGPTTPTDKSVETDA